MQLLMPLLIQSRAALVDTILSLQDFEGRVISVSEVYELPTEIHDLIDNVVSKWVGNTTCILPHDFNSIFMLCHEAWAQAPQQTFMHLS